MTSPGRARPHDFGYGERVGYIAPTGGYQAGQWADGRLVGTVKRVMARRVGVEFDLGSAGRVTRFIHPDNLRRLA